MKSFRTNFLTFDIVCIFLLLQYENVLHFELDIFVIGTHELLSIQLEVSLKIFVDFNGL